MRAKERMIITAKKEGIGYKVIQAALDRNVASKVDWTQFKTLDNLIFRKFKNNNDLKNIQNKVI